MLLNAREENYSYRFTQTNKHFNSSRGIADFQLIKVLPYQEMSAVHEHQQINIFEQKWDDSLDMHQFSPRMELD